MMFEAMSIHKSPRERILVREHSMFDFGLSAFWPAIGVSDCKTIARSSQGALAHEQPQ
jgi:hypothetical protein